MLSNTRLDIRLRASAAPHKCPQHRRWGWGDEGHHAAAKQNKRHQNTKPGTHQTAQEKGWPASVALSSVNPPWSCREGTLGHDALAWTAVLRHAPCPFSVAALQATNQADHCYMSTGVNGVNDNAPHKTEGMSAVRTPTWHRH